MTGAVIGVAVVLASYFAVSTAGALAARAASSWPRLDARLASPRALLRLRVGPTLLAATAAFVVVAPAFLRFEPRDAGERLTWPLALLAGGGLALIACSASRVLAELLRTRRLVVAWQRTARPISLAGCRVRAFSVVTVFPVVAVTGVLRPRLFVSAALLRRLTSAELSAVVGHEMGHLDAWDNVKRLLLRGSVDVLGWTGWARALEDRWHEAAEDEADDQSALNSSGARVDLADALLKVARLSGSLDLACPASALFRGERVARRVRRLLAPRDEAAPRAAQRGTLASAAGLLFAGAAFMLAIFNPAVHAALEQLVRALP